MKNKETLEEVAENESEYLADWEDKEMYQKGFIEGYKLAQERSYSEEDMREAFIAGGNSNITEDDGYGSRYLKYMEKWFKQFKKK